MADMERYIAYRGWISDPERVLGTRDDGRVPESAARSVGRRHDGFTLIELLIVMALIALMAGLVFPTLQFQFARVRTMTSARQVTAVFQRARLEAIRRNTPGVVELGDRRVVADIDGLTFFGLLSAGVDFGAPPGELIVDGFGASDKTNFTIAGGVQESGAFRIVGPRENYLEIRIDPPATARVQIRKWDGSAFKAQGEGGVSWTW